MQPPHRSDQLKMTPCATGLTMRQNAAAAVDAPLTRPFTLFLQLLFTACGVERELAQQINVLATYESRHSLDAEVRDKIRAKSKSRSPNSRNIFVDSRNFVVHTHTLLLSDPPTMMTVVKSTASTTILTVCDVSSTAQRRAACDTTPGGRGTRR
jgi:hypothetical protein